jgi:hypothetical protein
MAMMVVRIAKNTWEFNVKLPMVRCALGNNFDKLSLSSIRYSDATGLHSRLELLLFIKQEILWFNCNLHKTLSLLSVSHFLFY